MSLENKHELLGCLLLGLLPPALFLLGCHWSILGRLGFLIGFTRLASSNGKDRLANMAFRFSTLFCLG